MASKRNKPADGKVDLLWYGERGIINTIALALQKSGVPGVKALLEGVEWGKGKLLWIKRIKSVQLIVEVGCGQFGDPDLIIVCHGPRAERNVVFIEAKTTTYAASAASVSEKKGWKGFNSSINGQITLRYRLAHAMLNDHDDDIVEPDIQSENYRAHRDRCLRRDDKIGSRRLKKPGSKKLLKNAFSKSMKIENYFFIALTTDGSSFFDEDGFKVESDRPIFLGGNGEIPFENILPRLGWINYEIIKGIVCSDQASCISYCDACSTMAVLGISKSGNEPRDDDGVNPYYKSINRNRLDSKTRKLFDAFEEKDRLEFSNISIISCTGSLSFVLRENGKVIAKLLVPGKDNPERNIMVGTSIALGRSDWGSISGNRSFSPWEGDCGSIARLGGGSRQLFHVWRLTAENGKAAMEAVIALLGEIDEQHFP